MRIQPFSQPSCLSPFAQNRLTVGRATVGNRWAARHCLIAARHCLIELRSSVSVNVSPYSALFFPRKLQYHHDLPYSRRRDGDECCGLAIRRRFCLIAGVGMGNRRRGLNLRMHFDSLRLSIYTTCLSRWGHLHPPTRSYPTMSFDSMYSLSPAQVDSFHTNGFLLLEDALDSSTVHDIKQWTSEVKEWPDRPGQHMPYQEERSDGTTGLCRTESE